VLCSVGPTPEIRCRDPELPLLHVPELTLIYATFCKMWRLHNAGHGKVLLEKLQTASKLVSRGQGKERYNGTEKFDAPEVAQAIFWAATHPMHRAAARTKTERLLAIFPALDTTLFLHVQLLPARKKASVGLLGPAIRNMCLDTATKKMKSESQQVQGKILEDDQHLRRTASQISQEECARKKSNGEEMPAAVNEPRSECQQNKTIELRDMSICELQRTEPIIIIGRRCQQRGLPLVC